MPRHATPLAIVRLRAGGGVPAALDALAATEVPAATAAGARVLKLRERFPPAPLVPRGGVRSDGLGASREAGVGAGEARR